MVRLYKVDRFIILLLFLLQPLLSFVKFQGTYTTISLLFIFTFIFYFKYKDLRHTSSSYPLTIWLILVIYHWVNAMIKHVPEVNILDLLHGFKIYACIAIFTYLARRNFEATIRSLLICFELYLIFSFFINDISSQENGERMSGVIYATQLGQTAALTGIYIAYYSLYNRLSVFKSALLYILPITVILLTQSRNSLAMLIIGILGHAIAFTIQRGGHVKKVIMIIFMLAGLMFLGLDFVITNTELGSRLADTQTAQLTAENNHLATGTVFDNIVGDRLVYYIRGWQYFLESPLTGIGMWNYRYLSGGDYPLHSEYMVQLCEGGAIGFILWLLFMFNVIKGVLLSNQQLYIKLLATFSIIEILFCGIYARVFFYEFFYPIIGIAIALYIFKKNDNVQQLYKAFQD